MNIAFKFSIKGPNEPVRNSSYQVRIVSNDSSRLHDLLGKMKDEIRISGYVSIARLRTISGQEKVFGGSQDHEYHWGWTSLRTAVVLEKAEEFLLNLAPALLIEDGSYS